MADRNINESIRKPRRTRGTPFYSSRNYFALGALAVSATTWILYENWAQASILRQKLRDGKFDDSPELQEFLLSRDLGRTDPQLQPVVEELRRRNAEKQNKPRTQPWFSKLLSSVPDL